MAADPGSPAGCAGDWAASLTGAFRIGNGLSGDPCWGSRDKHFGWVHYTWEVGGVFQLQPRADLGQVSSQGHPGLILSPGHQPDPPPSLWAFLREPSMSFPAGAYFSQDHTGLQNRREILHLSSQKVSSSPSLQFLFLTLYGPPLHNKGHWDGQKLVF